jgi:hypothetical protein|tara:strand:+ start:819 stop:1037 length:219 start_codon:yes stop_codon:yes gene_type:complete
MLKKTALLLLAITFARTITAQETEQKRKTIEITRIEKPPIIDGVLNDDAWRNAELISDFVTFRPDNGKTVAA